jgi:hypothetical protein
MDQRNYKLWAALILRVFALVLAEVCIAVPLLLTRQNALEYSRGTQMQDDFAGVTEGHNFQDKENRHAVTPRASVVHTV